MLHYTFYQKNPASHYVYIDLVIDNISTAQLHLQLPSWRPGRYELGNFAKNIKRVDVYNEDKQTLNYTKLTKDLWQIETLGAKKVKITYSYYAAELNAGACFADTTQLYINPVHCCMYVPDRMHEPHVMELKVPGDYKIACSLPLNGTTLTADSFDELADSPFIASNSLQSDVYICAGINFYIHFNGICKPDFEKIKKHFVAFTQAQIAFWEDFPYDQYHFLIQVLPTKFYHGVEHKKNTVIAIGPGYSLHADSVYDELLGVSSHELFHVWNIKTIRPVEMLPYNFTAENYARTGYVYEGFTTYYGDKLLLTSNVFSQKQYFATLQERLQKHYHNFGRYNLSVAQSSWETWLDGYVPGAPYRKTNIYDEGSLIAFMLDVHLLRASNNTKSLRNICRLLYQRFGKTGKGYTEQDIPALVEEVTGVDASAFFTNYVYGTNDFTEGLKSAFAYLGLELVFQPAASIAEQVFGCKIIEHGTQTRVGLVAPYSPAWKAGLFTNDEIVAVNGMAIRNNLQHWLYYFGTEQEITVSFISGEQLKTTSLMKDAKGSSFFALPLIKAIEQPDTAQQAAYTAWLNL